MFIYINSVTPKIKLLHEGIRSNCDYINRVYRKCLYLLLFLFHFSICRNRQEMSRSFCIFTVFVHTFLSLYTDTHAINATESYNFHILYLEKRPFFCCFPAFTHAKALTKHFVYIYVETTSKTGYFPLFSVFFCSLFNYNILLQANNNIGNDIMKCRK